MVRLGATYLGFALLYRAACDCTLRHRRAARPPIMRAARHASCVVIVEHVRSVEHEPHAFTVDVLHMVCSRCVTSFNTSSGSPAGPMTPVRPYTSAQYTKARAPHGCACVHAHLRTHTCVHRAARAHARARARNLAHARSRTRACTRTHAYTGSHTTARACARLHL